MHRFVFKASFVSFLIFALLISATGLTAESKDSKKERELPKSGVLSGTNTLHGGGSTVEGSWGGDVLSQESPPVSGSISRDGRSWVMRVFNNSEDKYSVDVEVVQQDKSGKKLKSDYYSLSLAPGEKTERKLSANARTENCFLKLNKWTKKELKKKDQEEGETEEG